MKLEVLLSSVSELSLPVVLDILQDSSGTMLLTSWIAFSLWILRGQVVLAA